MSYEEWGPLANLIGTWESGLTGLDISFHNDIGEMATTPYSEKSSFVGFGPVDNGVQVLYGLDYRRAVFAEGSEKPLHMEVGYWMWDAVERQVFRCFNIPRGQAVMAGGTVQPGSSSFRLQAELGSKCYGILSNHYLEKVARATRFEVTVMVENSSFSYDETTTVDYMMSSTVILHTDRNTLTRVNSSAETGLRDVALR